MEHLAIDLGGRESQICVRSSDGQILEERRCGTAALAGYLASRPRSRVVVETCSEAFSVADAALAVGHDVRVVPAALVRSLGVGARRLKTDRRDARVLSEVSCRRSAVGACAQSASPAAQDDVRDAGRPGRHPHQTGQHRARMAAGRGTPPARRRGLHVFGSRPCAIPRGRAPQLCRAAARTIDALNHEIGEADRELAATTKADPIERRLVTVPGVGPATAVRFVAALDEISRFSGAHAVESYLGLVPGENSSAERRRRIGITKAGPTALRWCLVQAAWAARRTRRRDPMHRWADEVEKRRGKRVAVLALARKLAGILFAIWRDGTVYEPRRSGAV